MAKGQIARPQKPKKKPNKIPKRKKNLVVTGENTVSTRRFLIRMPLPTIVPLAGPLESLKTAVLLRLYTGAFFQTARQQKGGTAGLGSSPARQPCWLALAAQLAEALWRLAVSFDVLSGKPYTSDSVGRGPGALGAGGLGPAFGLVHDSDAGGNGGAARRRRWRTAPGQAVLTNYIYGHICNCPLTFHKPEPISGPPWLEG